MTTAELISRALERVGGLSAFYPETEIVQALNSAQILLALVKPDILITRTPVPIPAERITHDLRQEAPRLVSIRRVTLGDHSGEDPVPTQGRVGELRRSTVQALKNKPDWLERRDAFPKKWAPLGLYWIMTWPPATQSLTITLVGPAHGTPLDALTPNASPDHAEIWHPVIADVGAGIMMMKQGGQEVEKGLEMIRDAAGEVARPALGAVRRVLERERRVA